MTAMQLWGLLIALLPSVIHTAVLSKICSQLLTKPHQAPYNIQIKCDQLLQKQFRQINDLSEDWQPVDRVLRDTSKAEMALQDTQDSQPKSRVRRGGNYIRFGRSVSGGSSAQLLNSFGNRDTRGDGHYVRFGRSAFHESFPDQDAEKRFMRFGKSDKAFMRFGRDPLSDDEQDENKRFMRFGKKDHASENYEDEKRFMRFGKKDGSEMDEKRFMRFGRDPLTEIGDKRFMRFGKRTNSDILDDPLLHFETGGKRFMRFGKRADASLDSKEEEKRFMRFGKSLDHNSNQQAMAEKRFMRFGKSDPSILMNDDGQNSIVDEEKRFMRFGKKNSVFTYDDDEAQQKRFMRFGKRSENVE